MQLLLCLECFCMISKGFFLDCRKLHKDLIVNSELQLSSGVFNVYGSSSS